MDLASVQARRFAGDLLLASRYMGFILNTEDVDFHDGVAVVLHLYTTTTSHHYLELEDCAMGPGCC